MHNRKPHTGAAGYTKWIVVYLLSFYAVACFLLFVSYVRPSLNGRIDLRIGADSTTYLNAAEAIRDNGSALLSVPALISFQGQYLGPVIQAIVLRTNLNIAIFNIVLFVVGLWYASRLPGVSVGTFIFLILINPNTTISLLTLNKEIFSYISVILFVRYICSTKRSRLMLAVIVMTSLAARWEQLAIVLLFLFVEHRWSPLRGKHGIVLSIMIAVITLAWPAMVSSGIVAMSSLLSTAQEAQSNSLPALNRLQASYGFPLVLIPKIIGNMFGIPWKVLSNLFHPADYTNIQDAVVSPLQNLLMLAIFSAVWFQGLFRLKKETIYWVCLYLIMSAAAPIFQPRYEYPVYIMLCLELSGLISPELSVGVARMRWKPIKNILKSAVAGQTLEHQDIK